MTNRMWAKGCGVVALVFASLSATAVDAQRVLNNNKLRFGDGAQASINTSGNLEQPWYNDPALGGGVDPSWYKLTFSNRFMEAAIAAGGDGTNTHNVNGTILTNAALTGQVIDDSGFVPVSGNVGYGTLVSTGTVAIEGTTLELQNTYRLAQDDKFIRVEFRVRNTGAAPATNVRYWVGTGDDWIGLTDVPTKERGNFVSGAFQMLSDAATPSQMIRVYSGQSGVLFYSTNPAVGTAINSCCSFTNIVNQNPATSAITLTNDGSYGIFMRFADLAPGDSALLVWYYAAAPFSELNALGGQVAAAAGSVVTYSPTVFAEAAANDGTISTTATITIAGDTFTGSDGDNFIAASRATVTNVPAGLTPVLLRTSSTTATLSFAGTALSASNADDVGNLTVTFANTAFTGNDATALAGSNKSDLKIDFMDGGNTAPTALGDLTLAAVAEDTAAPSGEAINALAGLAFADSDAGDTLGGIAVVSNAAPAATQGRWQYSSDAGVTWADIGSVGPNSALSLSATTRVRFRPAADFNGVPTALVVRAMDSNASSFSVSTAPESRALIDADVNGGATFISATTNTISTSITAVNDAPTVAGPASISVTEDTARTLTGLSVADVDAATASVSLEFSVPSASGLLTATSGGGVLVSGSGSRTLSLVGTLSGINTFISGGGVTYTPVANAAGNVTLSLLADDGGNTGSGGALTGSRTVTLAIAAVNDAPTITAPGSVQVGGLGATALTGIVAADIDAGGGSVTLGLSATSGTLAATSGGGVTVVGGGASLSLSGTLANVNAFVAGGGVTFTPAGTADATLTSTINDNGNTGSGGALTASATTTLVANTPPVVTADRFVGVRNRVFDIAAPGVLANDADAQGQAMSALLVDGPTAGSLTLSADGAFRFTPPTGFIGELSFRYRACDTAAACSAPVAVELVVEEPLAARNDTITLGAAAVTVQVDVLGNDVFTADRLVGGSLSIVDAPGFGTASVIEGGDAATPADDRIAFTAPGDRFGSTALAYRLCEGAGRCTEGLLQINVNAAGVAAIDIDAPSNGGFHDYTFTGLGPMASPRVEVAGLATGRYAEVALPASTAPEVVPFREGAGFARLFTIPASATDREWGVLVDARSLSGGDIDLYTGLDVNGDRRPSVEETRCVSATSAGAGERCQMRFTVRAGETAIYWVMAHNADGTAQTAAFDYFEVPLDLADASIAASGPGRSGPTEGFPVRIAWHDADFVQGDARAAFLRVWRDDQTHTGWVPVRINRSGALETPVPMSSGVPVQLTLREDESYRRLFIDVPEGIDRLVVRTRGVVNTDMQLLRSAAPSASPAIPEVGLPVGPPSHVTNSPSGNEELVVDQPQAGRWYVVVANRHIERAEPEVTATLVGAVPAVTPGSYFNRGRPGAGFFVYPAGGDWAALWYAYLQDGTPTWYYLQAAAPGPDGLWRSRIFRSAWNGQANRLAPVGEARMTPRAGGGFTFTYTLDGQTGTEAYEGLGGGCPSLAGAPIDASGHWFDPVRAGTGYSVQLFPDYEFYLVFGYDDRGVPRYLVAERPGFGGASTTLDLEQNNGACPLCAYNGNPTRRTVGTLTRTFSGGTLQRMQLDGAYVGGVPGAWAANDTVIPLGALQGCSAN